MPSSADRNLPIEAMPSLASIPLETIPFDTTSQSRWTPEQSVRYEDLLVSRRALARWYDITPQRLAIWAREGYGPEPLRLGGYKIAYRVGDCLAFINSRPAAEWPDVRRKNQKSEISCSQARDGTPDGGKFMLWRGEREKQASTSGAKEGAETSR